MHAHVAAGEPCGVLFGPERTGLLNDDLTLADTVLTVPLNPGFSSLNLAQAVLIVGYEWFTAAAEAPPETLHTGLSRPATKAELSNFFAHLEEELVKNGFLRNRESRPSMVRNLRSLFQRAHCTEQELRTLHGVVTAFAGPRERGKTMGFDALRSRGASVCRNPRGRARPGLVPRLLDVPGRTEDGMPEKSGKRN